MPMCGGVVLRVVGSEWVVLVFLRMWQEEQIPTMIINDRGLLQKTGASALVHSGWPRPKTKWLE